MACECLSNCKMATMMAEREMVGLARLGPGMRLGLGLWLVLRASLRRQQ